MRRPMAVWMIVAAISLANGAWAQSAPPQNMSGVSQQLATGAQHVGTGAAQMGEGIKNAAILTWQAVVAGVTTTASRLDGSSGTQRAN